MSTPNVEEVERLVIELQKGVSQFGTVDGQDAVSAVMTFTYRFMNAAIVLTAKEDRAANVEKIAAALRRMATLIEFEHSKLDKEVMH